MKFNLQLFKLVLALLIITFLSQAASATQRTWTGSASTDYGTAGNWNPSGVPANTDTVTIVTGSNNVYLGANRTVAKFTITSGTMDLQTFTLNITGTAAFTSGTINNGTARVNSTLTTTFSGTTFGAVVNVSSNSVLFNGSVFNANVTAVKKGTTPDNCTGGNKFLGTTVSLTDSNSGDWVFANNSSSPDTFNAELTVKATVTGGYIYLAHQATGNLFNGKVRLNGNIVHCNEYGTATYEDSIIVNVTNTAYFGLVSGSCIANKPIAIAPGAVPIITFHNFNQANTTDTIKLTATGGRYNFETGSEFHAPVIASGKVYLNGTRFFNTCSFTNTSATTISTGGNYFANAVTMIATSSFTIASATVDTFASTVYIENNGIFEIDNAVFLGNTTFKNTTSSSADKFFIANTGSCQLKGAVTIDNAGSGMITGNGGGTVVLDNGISLTVTSSHNLKLNNFTINGSSALTLAISGKLYMGTGTVVNRPFTFTGSRIFLNGSTFNNTVDIIRSLSNTADASDGGCVFNGVTTITDSSISAKHLQMAVLYPDTFNASVTFTEKGSGTTFIQPAYTKNTVFKGNVTVNGTAAVPFGANGGKVIFAGSAAQTLNKTGSFGPTFKKIEVNKSGGSLKLNVPVTLTTDSFILTKGVVITDATNILAVPDNGIMAGGSDSGYVHGPIKKTGNDAFTFFLGDTVLHTGAYHPLTITAASSTTDSYTAQYYASGQISGSGIDNTMENLSGCEYWNLVRNTGSSNVSVTLGWNSNSCNVFSLANMKVAGWNGSSWIDKGNSATTGNTTVGTVKTSAAVSTFGPFALADNVCTTLSATTSTTAVTCYGGNNGSATATPHLGTSAYTYLWSNSATTQIASGLSIGTYAVTVTDHNGCTATSSTTITEPSVLSGSIASTDETCHNNSHNGTLAASVSGGSGGYTYSWSTSPVQTTATAMRLYSGTYSVTITDANGCQIVRSGTVGYTENCNYPDLGDLANYAILAQDSIYLTTSFPIYVEGKAGAAVPITPLLTAEEGNEINTSGFNNAVNDLIAAKTFCSSQSGASVVSDDLRGEILTEGVYNITGDWNVDTVITLDGDSNSVFIFNISGDLNFIDFGILKVEEEIMKNRIFYNVGGSLTFAAGNIAPGVFLVNSSIEFSGFSYGNKSLLGLSTINFINPQHFIVSSNHLPILSDESEEGKLPEILTVSHCPDTYGSISTIGNGSNSSNSRVQNNISASDDADVRVYESCYEQAEVSIAINHNDPNNILISANTNSIAVWADVLDHPYSCQGYYYSLNGGIDWNGDPWLPNNGLGNGDPVACFDASGNGYLVTMGPNTDGAPYVGNGTEFYNVQKTTDGGQTWITPPDFWTGDQKGPLGHDYHDREHATFDGTLSSPNYNKFYCAWTDPSDDFNIYINESSTLCAATSTSPPVFSTPVNLTSNTFPVGCIGANVQSGPDGQVYVAWAHIPQYSNLNYRADAMGFAAKKDNSSLYVTNSNAISFSGIHGNDSYVGDIRIWDYISMAVDKSCSLLKGRVYVAFAADDPSSGFKSVIYLSHTDNPDDLSPTWSSPIAISIPGATQSFMPWITVDDATGLVSVVYYCFANLSAPNDCGGNPFCTSVYVAYSADGSSTWDNIRISDNGINFTTKPIYNTLGGGYMGDYIGIDSYKGKAYAAWMDDRTFPKDFQVYYSKLEFQLAHFSATDNCQSVDFTDESAFNPTSWAWIFGDGNTASTQNPTHTYTVPGVYNVELTATNDCGYFETITLPVTVVACCNDYPNTLTQTDFDASGTINDDYNLNSNVTIASTIDIILDAASIDIASGMSITVESGATLTIQNGSHLYACKDIWQGILVEDGGFVTIESGSFIENAITAVDAESGSGVNIFDSKFDNNATCVQLTGVVGAEIDNNEFYNFTTGIYANNLTEGSSLIIDDNNFNMDLSGSPVPKTYGDVVYAATAISMKAAISQTTLVAINCLRNNISNAAIGIHLMNLDGEELTAIIVSVEDNKIYPTISATDLATTPNQIGMWLQGISHSMVTGNGVEWNGTPGDADNMVGIMIEGSETVYFENNAIVNVPTGMVIYNSVINTSLNCTKMDACYTGINMVSATMSTQGASGAGNGVEWLNFGSGNIRVDGYTSSGSGVAWYFVGDEQPSFPTYNQYSPYLYALNTVTSFDNQSNNATCGPYALRAASLDDVKSTSTSDSLANLKLALDSIIAGNENFTDFPSQNKYFNRQFAYRALRSDTALLNSSEEYKNFLSSSRNTNIGKYHESDSLLHKGNINGAKSVLESIIDTNTIEANKKTIRTIVIRMKEENRDTFTVAEKTTLSNIAYQLAVEGGEGVYEARALLNLDIVDVMSAYRKGEEVKKHSDAYIQKPFLIYPNPSAGVYTVSYKIDEGEIAMMEVYNLVGAIVSEIKLVGTNTSSVIDLSKYKDGYYQYRISINGMVRQVGKMIIIK